MPVWEPVWCRGELNHLKPFLILHASEVIITLTNIIIMGVQATVHVALCFLTCIFDVKAGKRFVKHTSKNGGILMLTDMPHFRQEDLWSYKR